MDVIALAQQGIRNAVATLGTATSEEHIKRLFRLVPSILFCFDGDQAGRKAAWRARESVLPNLQDGSACASCSSPRGGPGQPGTRRGRGCLPRTHHPAGPAAGGVLLPATDARGRPRHPEGKAHLATLAAPPLEKIPGNNLRLLMRQRLSEITGLSGEKHRTTGAPQPAAVVHGSRSERHLGRRRLFRRQRLTTRTSPPMRRSTLRQAMARRNRARAGTRTRSPGTARSGMARRSGTKAAAATSRLRNERR
ncbi:toprim domain-containing protein [Pseudomonas aeruginosa]